MVSLFENAVEELVRKQDELDERLIEGLSDASRSQARWFGAQIRGCSSAWRRDLVQRMVTMVERRFEMDFGTLFRACLDADDPEVRRLAIEGLWEDTRPDLARRLVARLAGDKDVRVRTAAASALGRFVFMAECDELDAELSARIRQALENVIMEGGDVDLTRHALESVAYINDGKIRAMIEDAYEHESQRMRESAVFAMGRSADTYWSDTILLELRAPSPAMRYEAVRAAGEMMLRNAVSLVIELVDDSDAEVRIMAVWALGQIGGKQARTVIERLIKSEDEAMVMAAEEALSELEFAKGGMELFVHEVSDETDLYPDDYDDVIEDDEDAVDDVTDEWDGDALRLP